MSKIEELENKLMELQKEFEEFKNKENKRWFPEKNRDYYYYDKDAEKVEGDVWQNRSIDNTRLKNKVIFKTFEEAEEYANYQKAKKEYSYEFSNEEWENSDISKYYIDYDYDCEDIDIDYAYCYRHFNQIYFETREKTEEFLNKYKKQILKYEFEIEE